MTLLVKTGKNPKWYADQLDVLLKCLSTPNFDHSKCHHHPVDKPPRPEMLVTCPFHFTILSNFIKLKLQSNADSQIDEELGRVHNNVMEIGYKSVWSVCPKRVKMSHLAFVLYTTLGLMNSNRHVMFKILGPNYSHINQVKSHMDMEVSNSCIHVCIVIVVLICVRIFVFR